MPKFTPLIRGIKLTDEQLNLLEPIRNALRSNSGGTIADLHIGNCAEKKRNTMTVAFLTKSQIKRVNALLKKLKEQ
jgi:hypothetical protein